MRPQVERNPLVIERLRREVTGWVVAPVPGRYRQPRRVATRTWPRLSVAVVVSIVIASIGLSVGAPGPAARLRSNLIRLVTPLAPTPTRDSGPTISSPSAQQTSSIPGPAPQEHPSTADLPPAAGHAAGVTGPVSDAPPPTPGTGDGAKSPLASEGPSPSASDASPAPSPGTPRK